MRPKFKFCSAQGATQALGRLHCTLAKGADAGWYLPSDPGWANWSDAKGVKTMEFEKVVWLVPSHFLGHFLQPVTILTHHSLIVGTNLSTHMTLIIMQELKLPQMRDQDTLKAAITGALNRHDPRVNTPPITDRATMVLRMVAQVMDMHQIEHDTLEMLPTQGSTPRESTQLLETRTHMRL